ncbi:helix-turn-helix domain-containing protein [Listeria booriae]|uniref:helix-turn-helix domain-containing protein n=1 Tax=Listeria booriae TaxID=1552123 RepID=UPI001627548F|nr:helix-turn-helix transcriptional regulator [Listeria booriae]MBC1982818.1 helix-turn-helix transcriptional regulator [Listeria booriae]
MTLEQAFAEVVRTKLRALGIKQYELAEMLGIKPQYLSDILNSNRKGEEHKAKIREILAIKESDYK